MKSLRVDSFDFDIAITREYLELIRALHRADPCFLLPLHNATIRLLQPSHGFYQAPENRHRRFTVRCGTELLGHLQATVNGAMRDQDGAAICALGFVESIDDYDAFKAMLDAACDWVRRHTAAGRVWATMNFDIWHDYRVMTRGFQEPPFFGEPRNSTWLPEFLTQYGFTPRRQWVSTTTDRDYLINRAPYFRPRYEEVTRSGYSIERLKPRNQAHMRALHAGISTAFGDFLGYTAISFDEFNTLIGRYLRFVSTKLATTMRAPGGEFIGFSIAYPDPTATLQRLRGRDDWSHRLRLLTRRQPSARALYYMIGVLGTARSEHKGLGSALLYDTLQRILDAGYAETTFALMAEDSPARYFAMDQVQRAEREYALFELEL